ncbi:MAG: ribonuclease P protein component [Candidatus Pacebacteria bacterium]|nr:ribonuclease P protein component [Candidatus Paceibacterota bacterium]MBP9840091.1 ribonuclease P protein component [Candidatus Paceibacterota bacterium]
MLPRRQRLSRPGFAALSRGKRAASAHFLVIFAPPPARGCAVVVPKKVASRAVDRHLLKRRVSAVIGPSCSSIGALVVHAKPGALALSYPALRQELLTLIHSAMTPARHR